MLGRKQSTLSALILGTALLAVTACGGESLSETGDGGQTEAAAAVELKDAPEEDKAGDVIDAIEPNADLTAALPAEFVEDGLKMTTSEGYPPMDMLATDGVTLVGVDPSLGRAIAHRMGVNIDVMDEDFNSQIPGITTGRYDLLMSSMTDTEERRQSVTFVDYVSAGTGFVVKAGNPSGVKTPEDLCGKTVGVVDNGSSLALAEEFSADCKSSGKEGIEILKFPGDQEAILQVRNGRADAGINDYPVAVYRAETSNGELEAVAIEGGESLWGIAMNPENKELIETVQKALQELIDDGTYRDVLDAWGVGQMAIDEATINLGE